MVDATNGIDWGDVSSVRFALLLRSRQSNARTEAVAQTVDLVGKSVTTPADRHLRRVFGSVVTLRNNLP